VKSSDFSTSTFLCLVCEDQLLAQVRQWATIRAHDMAQQAIARQRSTSSLLNQVRRTTPGRAALSR
jgi:hypothetical protein